MRVLSLFDGIGTGRLALERAGIEVAEYYASEIDKYAISIARYRYPDITHIGDVEKIDFTKYAGKIDLVLGGSPCSNLSRAGDRSGLDGSESRLFWEYVRCLKECKPKWFLLENVASMTNDDKETMSQALGCYPVMIDSALVSGQQRKRYYWFNFGRMTYDMFLFPTCAIELPRDKGIVLNDILEDGVGVVTSDLGRCIDRLSSKSICLRSRDYKGFSGAGRGMTSVMTPIKLGEFGKGGQAQRVYSVVGKSVTLKGRGGGQGAKTGLYRIDLPDGDYVVRTLTPLESERLQTLPDEYTKFGIDDSGKVVEISNTQRKKCIGNGWTADVVSYIFSFLKKEFE